MSRVTKIWLLTALLLLVYAVLVWFLAPLTGLTGRDAWVLRGGLWLLGLVAAVAVGWYLHRKARAEAGAAAPADADVAEIDAAVATAQERLAAAKLAGGARLGALPAVLVLGPAGGAKTTMIVRSGLEPELLAGEVFRGEQIVPTRLVNLWYVRGPGSGGASGAILAEAGGQVATEAPKRTRLLQRLQPLRLGAALGRGAQAPRLAVVCFPCDEFLKPGSTDSVPAAARQLRAVLAETAEALGIRLPVYVLFTKMDRVPGFADFVQNLSRDEVREVLGTTLPAVTGDGIYAERETARLSEAFRQLVESLAARRLAVLPREHAAERKPGAYEFPREVRKIAPLAVQFLVELGRPSQLAVSPFVRGFYFTGVRAVVITEQAGGGAAVVAAPGAPAAPQAASGATSVFGALRTPGAAGGPAAPAVPAAAPVTRKKPQWVFLERVFPEVVLADEAARRATEAGTRVSGMRRALLAAAALLFVLLGGAFTLSWAGNRGIARRTIRAVQATTPAAGAVGAPAAPDAALGALPDVDALRRLDSLRAEVARLGEYGRDGAPLRLRWGLYTGDRLYPDARRAYFARFERTLLAPARGALLRTLQGLPESPTTTTDYGPTYDALKAYLITSGHADKSTVPFLAPALLRAWLDGRQLDPERTALAQRQFEFYADELRRADPYDYAPEQVAVERGRAFLRQFEGADRIYQFMASEAARSNAAVQFNRSVPGSAAYVVDTYEVPGAFTKGGWAFMQDALKNVDRFLKGEEWVLGPDATAPTVDRRELAAQLRARYEADYVRHWREYLRAGRVARYANLKDAAQKLQALSGPQSPLLAMLALASRNTAVDSAGAVTRAFQPVHAVLPPAVTDKYVSEANAPYVQALAALGAAVDQAAAAPPGQGEAAAQQAAGSASQAKLAVNQVAQGFNVDTAGHVEAIVQQLLSEPIVAVEPYLRNVGSGELNAAGARFCASFGTLMGKYPFDPNAATEATVDEVAGMFKPGTGLMWTFYDEVLQKVLARQGNQVVPRPGAPMAPNAAFVGFFNRAALLSAALFPDGSEDPRFSFALRPVLSEAIPGVTVAVDNQVARFTRTANDLTPFQWQASTARSARLAGQLGGAEVNFLGPYNGPWALFKLFHRADRWQGANGTYTVEWTPRMSGGQPMTLADGTPVRVVVELRLPGVPPVLQRGWFDGLRCVSRVAQ
ncbi:MAG TPA: ImcF-related family protein [Gemmatimonadaceae bacterium]|nr:ImcF-related family protein [Gemmatimonadaceae bacterium]